jgi:hypothetical protein
MAGRSALGLKRTKTKRIQPMDKRIGLPGTALGMIEKMGCRTGTIQEKVKAEKEVAYKVRSSGTAKFVAKTSAACRS